MEQLIPNLPYSDNCGYIYFMKKLPAIFLLLALFCPTLVLARVNVEISNNGPGSKSSVNVESQINSSTSTKNSINNQTDIKIESNGEVKEYHGSDENIRLESGNGNNSVSVRSNITNENSYKSASPSASISPQPSTSAEPDKPEEKNPTLSLLDIIKREVESFLNLFFS